MPPILLARLSFCLLFSRLFSPNVRLRWLIYFAIAYNIIIHLGGLLITIFLCLPGPGDENFFQCSYKTTTLDIAISSMNIFSDFYLVGLPILAVSSLHKLADGQRAKAWYYCCFFNWLLVNFSFETTFSSKIRY